MRDLIAATGLVILLKLDSNRRFFIKLCASSQTPGWIKTGVNVRKRSIPVKIVDFWSHVTLKFDGWPWKTTGHLVYATLSLMHHIKAIREFKLELQSGNAQFGSKLAIFLSYVTLKFDGWPWKIIGHLFYVASSFVYHFIAISEFKLKLQYGNAQFGSKSAGFFIPCDLDIWWMTLRNNRAPLLCYLELFALFRSHWWTKTRVTVRKRPISVKIDDFF